MKQIKHKKINWFIATKDNALWLNQKIVVNSLELFAKYLIKKEKELFTYTGRWRKSFYFNLTNWARLRLSDHDVYTDRSISDICIIRDDYDEFDNIKHDWYNWVAIPGKNKLAKNNFEFYVQLLKDIKEEIKNFNFNPSIIKRVKYEILKFNSSYWNNVYFDRDTVSSNLLNEKFYNLLKEIKKQNFIYNSNLELKFLKELKLKLNIENWKIIWLNFQCKNWERSVPFSEYLFNN